MRYKLFNKVTNPKLSFTDIIFRNREIEDKSPYYKLCAAYQHDYNKLSNIEKGVQLLLDSIKNKLLIIIVVDCDVDGFTSSAELYNYIVYDLGYKNVKYLMHNGKEHGLSSEIMNQIELENKDQLIVLPDAGTNDIDECLILNEHGINVLVLDHHEQEILNPYAVIINNQIGDYPNKSFSGVGVVHKFLQAIDDENWTEYSEKYTDLVALGNIADIMDLRNLETYYYCKIGLQNIRNNFIKAIINKQSYSISSTEVPTFIDVSFYIAPLINAMIRVGSNDEKTLVFRAFINDYEEFDYMPRKSKNNPEPTMIKETIYERAARLCANAKSRQDKIKQKSSQEIMEKWAESNKDNIIFIANVTGILDSTLTGITAMEIAKHTNKPTLLLRADEKKSTKDQKIFSGSARNIKHGLIEHFKDELSLSNLFVQLRGHQNAFGASINKNNIDKMTQFYIDKYKNDDTKNVYHIDFEFSKTIPYQYFKEIDALANMFSSSFEEPLVCVKDILCDPEECTFMGKEKNHLSIVSNDVTYVIFNVKEDEEIAKLVKAGTYPTINIVGKTQLNKFAGKVTPQVIISEYEIVK